jgi:chemotaxis protein CheC
MTTTFMLSRPQMARLNELASAAVGNVSRGLTEMFSADVLVTAMHIRVVSLGEVGVLLGDPEMEVVAVYLRADGSIPANLLLMMEFPTALELCDILLELTSGTTEELGEMETSALGEVGNIVGSFFLNSLAEQVGMRLDISPPFVLQDMAGAAIGMALTEVAMFADEAVVIDANFEHRGRHLPAWFLAFPEPGHLRLALDAGAQN